MCLNDNIISLIIDYDFIRKNIKYPPKLINLELKDSEIRQKYAPDCAQSILPES